MSWLKIKAAARHAGVSERTLRGWLRIGLPHAKLPSTMILISDVDIDDWLKQFVISHNEIDRIVDSITSEIL